MPGISMNALVGAPAQRPVRAPAVTVADRRLAVIDALVASLRDDGAQLGDTTRLVDWLAQRAAGRRHEVAVTGAALPVGCLPLSCQTQEGGLVFEPALPGASGDLILSLGGDATPPYPTGEVPPCHLLPVDAPAAGERAVLGARLAAATAEPANRERHWRRTMEVATGIVASLAHHAGLLGRAHVARKEALSRAASRIMGGAPERGATDALRAELTDALQALGRSIADRCRRTVASESGVQARMLAEVGKTCAADFARDTARQGVRITLGRDLQMDLQHALERHVEQDVRTMVDEGNALLKELEALARRTLDAGGACTVARLQVEPFMERVVDLMQINVRFRGTLPRRGFVQRLAEGRKSIFTILMFVSLFGSFVGFNWRSHPLLGWLFMVGFLFAVGWTYRSWQDDDHERMEEELEKAREQLRMECRRALGDIYRELQTAFVETLEGTRRALVGDVDEVARAVAAAAQRDAQSLREAAQGTIRQIEGRDTAIAAWRQGLARIEGELLALRTEAAT